MRGTDTTSRSGRVALTAALLLAVGCAGRRPNVLLVSLDTVRADHLSVYGYPRLTTPNLEALAREAVVFERVFTPVPWTVGAHISLLSSLHPGVHGIAHLEPQSESPPMLAEHLKAAGYRTAAFVHPVLDPRYGFGKGFDHYYRAPRPARAERERRAEALVDRALRWLAEGERTRPFFVFLHLYDAHHPYAPPAPFDTVFHASYRRDINRVVDSHPYDQDKDLPPEALAEAIALYDGEIRYLDHTLGRLFARLREQEIFDSSLIAVLADHGEGFLEHGLMNHGNSVYEELIRVPLIMRFPGGRFGGGRSAQVVRLLDLAPTVLELTESRPLPLMQGSSLVPLLRGATGGRLAYVSGAYASCLRSDGWKLIENPPSRFRLIPRSLKAEHELYDLERDPAEQANLAHAGRAPAMVKALHGLEDDNRRLRQRIRAGRDVRTLDLTDEQREQLRALGYID